MTEYDATRITEQNLQHFLGQAESYRLEFKSGRLLEQKERALETLSKEVSAFANAEGGLILIGISERKAGKANVADTIDGVDLTTFSTPWLQQALEASVSPPIAGIRYRTIPLAAVPGRACITIVVPRGTTAHQAQDKRYYGRSEFEARPLADHDIRLRMQRGRVSRATVELGRWCTSTHFRMSDGFAGAIDRHFAAGGLGHIRELDELQLALDGVESLGRTNVFATFALVIVNRGELTIRDLSLELTFRRGGNGILFLGENQADVAVELPIRWDLPASARIHPGQSVEAQIPLLTVCGLSDGIGPGDAILEWVTYLPDSTPCSGQLDVGSEILSGSVAAPL